MMTNESFMVEQFGGINQKDLRTAFTRATGKSSTGHMSQRSIGMSKDGSPRS